MAGDFEKGQDGDNRSLRLIEPLNYFETHYWRFRQTYFFWKQLTVRSLQSK